MHVMMHSLKHAVQDAKTALMYAVEAGHVLIARMLIEAHAQVDLQDRVRRIPGINASQATADAHVHTRILVYIAMRRKLTSKLRKLATVRCKVCEGIQQDKIECTLRLVCNS